MRRWIRVTTALAALSGTASLLGCMDQTEELIVVSVADAGEGCAVSSDGSVSRPLTVVDTSFPTGAIFWFVLQNNLLPKDANSTSSGTDDSEVMLVDVDVRLVDSVSGTEIVAFNQALSTISIPGGERRAAPVTLAPDVIAGLGGGQAVGDQREVLVQVEFHALRTGNQVGKSKIGRIDAREYSHPMQVCFGCLRQCEPQLVSYTDDEGNTQTVDVCPEEVCYSTQNITSGGSCSNAQDLPVVPRCCDATTAMDPACLDAVL